MTEANQTDQGQTAGAGVTFSLKKIYTKDLSFECPHSPQIFTQALTPNVEIQIAIKHAAINQDEGFYDVVLGVTATAKLQDKVAFLAEVQQAGVFQVSGVSAQEVPMVLEIACPNILLPFARETIADLVSKGGFPQLLIDPVNFEALYLHKKQSEEQGAVPAAAAPAKAKKKEAKS